MSLRGHLTAGPSGDRLSLSSVMSSSEIDTHIHCLADTQKHEDEKLRSVQEIWDKYDVYSGNTNYYHSLERFMKSMIQLLTETTPQFIAEYTVQKLRHKCLELMLRMANHECVKNQAKEITKCMLRCIQTENERNAILALKVLADVWKANKLYYLNEITACTAFFKTLVKQMTEQHVKNGMFDVQDFTTYRNSITTLDEGLIESCLDRCYHVQPISISRSGTAEGKVDYTLIPKSSMSVKLIQDLSLYFVFMYQHHKPNTLNDLIEFIVICIEFTTLQLPSNYKEFQGVAKELMDDFHQAQSKLLSFITIMGKIPQFMEVLLKNSNNIINSILTILETLDDKSVSTRKDVLMALKFVFTSELKNSVVRFLPRMLDEDSILGKGFTSRDNLRVFLYQILADLLHHIRGQLSFPLLLQASSIFCREMNDPSISFQTQVMCVRLLCSICEALPAMEQKGEATRDILWQTLDNLAYKMEILATYHLPLLVKTYGLEDSNGRKIMHHELLHQQQEAKPSTSKEEKKPQEIEEMGEGSRASSEEEPAAGTVEPPLPPFQKSARHTPPDVMLTNLYTINSPAMTVLEARNFIKYLLMTVKNCCVNIATSAKSNLSYPVEKERDIMENILKFGLLCMDVYLLPTKQSKEQLPQGQRCKEEKEALDNFANIFITMDSDVYKEIFARHICMLIERINSNATVQLFANAFLVRSDWVCKFGGIMIRYLMDNMDKLAGGSNPNSPVSSERTALYMKLFKIIFSAIGCGNNVTTEAEMMLKPYLPDLIRKATEYAITAKEPLNYFLLLRALFRSIGGGAHDILYGQFLPLLPNLLQFLNKLQSCNTRLQLRELFLELCLTVPVRLSSLLPYLPLLMDPLVCALNGSTALVQQGLRTLELCVDNLQPEYLFEHMAPVRSSLIQGLWRVLSTSSDMTSAQTAFRILGKFGGANRRILNSPQLLHHVTDTEFQQTVLTLEFQRNHPDLPVIRGELSLSEIVAVATEQMGHLCYRVPRVIQPDSMGSVVTLMPHHPQPAQFQLIKESCMDLAKSILVSLFVPDPRTNISEWRQNILDNFKDIVKKIDSTTPGQHLFKGAREHERKTCINALAIIMMGVIQKDLRPRYYNFYMAVIRQLTINALLEAITPSEALGDPYRPTLCLDGAILIDAMTQILADTNKDFLSSATFAITQMYETCEACISDKDRFIQFPILRYMMESVTNLCWGPSWFARLGGANGLIMIIRIYPVSLIEAYLHSITEGLIEVIVGLSDEIGSGASDHAQTAIKTLHEKMLKEYDVVNDPKGYVATMLRVYLPVLFTAQENARNIVWNFICSFEKDFKGPPMKDLLAKHMDIINHHKMVIFSSLACMSMNEQLCSLTAINLLLNSVPDLLGLDFNDSGLDQFFETIFDICEHDVLTLLSKDHYKSLDNCPGHFLPPYPMTEQMEGLKIVTIRTLILSYKALCLDNPVEDERKSIFGRRTLKIGAQSALFGSESLQKSATEALLKCAPIPLDILKIVGEGILNSFNDSNGDVENIVKMETMIMLNNEFWNKELALKFVNLIETWQKESEEGFPARTVEDIKCIQSVMRLVLQGDVLDCEMVLKLVHFIAFFEMNYTTDTDFGWISTLCDLIARYPLEIFKTFCSKKFLGSYVSFLCKILEHDKAAPIRKILKEDPTFFENLIQLKTLENGTWEAFIAKDMEALNVYEESIMRIVDTVASKESEWFENNHTLIEQMRKIWRSRGFGNRYSIAPVFIEEDGRKLVRVQTFPASKLNVPHLFGKNFVRYLKKNPEAFDLLFDIMLAFDGCFATDFGFVRDFLEFDVIPTRSIPWRIRLFEFILSRLLNEPEHYLKNNLVARYIQYALIPCLQFIFERYDVRDTLGPGLPPEEDSVPEPDHCMARLTTILEKNRFTFSEPNIIAMYQLCTLIVEHAPSHIHNNECKKQGTRLRIFMVFVWNTLTSSASTHILDPTVRFTGYLFLAHLIDKFTINRKIVLQVYNTLLQQYQLDNRDLVRRAIDVVTPAVPIRLMDDGNQQLLIHVKKILTEDAHNIHQISHIVQAVCRNYKVYYAVRHDLISPLLTAVSRTLHSVTGAIEGFTGRRLSLDVCEMAIKWELLRHRYEAQQDPQKGEAMEVESVLESLKTNEKDERDDVEKRERTKEHIIGREHIDGIINILLKFACNSQAQNMSNTSPHYMASNQDLGRRALGLLRAALKPDVWGEVAIIKYSWLEKQLTIPSSDYANSRPDSQHAYAQYIQTAQQTLDVLLALSSSMSRSLLLGVLKPLQRALISCMMQNYAGGHGLIKTLNYLIQKLFEKAKATGVSNGLEELDTFSQYLIKYLNDSFTNYYKSQNGMVQQIFTPFSVLRAICAHQPSYLDATCLPTFLKVMEKVVRDQMNTHLAQDNNREKTTVDFIAVSLELMRLRVGYIGAEHRRTLCQNILLPLIDKCPYEKVIECLIRMTNDILVTHNDRNASNPGLPLAVRLHATCERRFLRSSKDANMHPLMAPYLAMVLVIFENPSFKNSEAAPKMANAFYWGLMSPDPDTRRKFLVVWERGHQPFVLARLMTALKEESWHHFRKYYWIRHVIWLLLQASTQKPFGEYSLKRPIHFGDNCTTLAKTLEIILTPQPGLGATSMDCTVTSSFSSPGTSHGEEPMDTSAQTLTKKEHLIMTQRNFLCEVLDYDQSHVLNNIYNLMFNTSDQRFTPKIFRRLFCSIWFNLLPTEKEQFQAAIIPFLTSGVHNGHLSAQNSVLIAWMEAIDQTGEIKLPPKLLHFISKNHNGHHKGLLILERETRFLEMKYAHLPSPEMRNLMQHAYGDNENAAYRESLDYLAALYKDLDELDPYAAIWDRRAIKQETVNVFNHTQRGEVREAFKACEDAVIQLGDRLTTPGNTTIVTPPLEQEVNQLFDEYAHCCEELLEWEKLRDYANHSTVESPALLMKAAMHIPDWSMVRDCLDQLMGCIPQKLLSVYHIYQMMSTIMQPMRREHNELLLNQPVQGIAAMKQKIEKFLDDSVNHHISWWRQLPSVVGPAHVKVLQSASMIREVADCIDLRMALDASNPQTFNVDLINQIKHITKVWRNRLCAVQDELAYQAMVYDWRTQVHLIALRRLEEWEQNGSLTPLGTNSQLILPVHSSAQGQIILAKAAKSMRLYDLAIETLNKLHTISAVPAMDAHTKICEHLKMFRLQAEKTTDPKVSYDFYQLGLHMINETDITYFAPDQVSRIFSVRGQFLGGLDKREEALKSFSLATQIIMEKQPPQAVVTVSPTSAFKAWGDHQDKIVQLDQGTDRVELSAMTAGAGAISCFFEVARGTDNDSRARKYIGKLLWTSKQMIAAGDMPQIRMNDIIKKNERTTIPYNWLCWLPQVINDIRHRPTSAFTMVLTRVCEDFPLQVFYHLRCVLPPMVTDTLIQEICLKKSPLPMENMEPWIQALVPVMRTAITARQADSRVFHTFLNELFQMREFWAERQYRFALHVRNEITRAINVQNQTQQTPSEAMTLDQDCLTAIHIWKTDFENSHHISFLQECELRYMTGEIKPLVPEEEFVYKMSEEIRVFFEGCPCPRGMIVRYLEQVINITKQLHNRIALLPRNIPIKLASPWLAQFTNRVGCIEMPRDLFHVQKTVGSSGRISFPSPFSSKDQQYTTSQYCSMIARVDPFFSVSIEGGEVVKRVCFRSINGKNCVYYLKRSVKEKIGVNHCNQFLEHMNHMLAKERETARRYLSTCVLIQLRVGYGCTLLETANNIHGDCLPETKLAIHHPTEILAQKLQPVGMHPDDAVVMFYDRIFSQEDSKEPEHFARQSVLLDYAEDHFIGSRNLIDFFMKRYSDPTMFFSFRKQVAKHMAVLNILDFLLRLTPPTLQDIYIIKNYGQYTVPSYAFQLPSFEMPRHVPFRLTHNFYNFLSYAADGDMRWSAESTITCLRHRRPEVYLQPLLYDFVTEMVPGTYKDHVYLVNKLIYDFASRIKNYDTQDPTTLPNGVRVESVDILMKAATSNERISLMDPAHYPWF